METTELTQNVDREALVVQLRALASAIEHLADVVDELAPEASDTIERHLDEARWQLKQIW